MPTNLQKTLADLGADLPDSLDTEPYRELSDREVWLLILAVLSGYSGGGGGGGVTVPAVPVNNVAIRTPNIRVLTAGQSVAIPVGAQGWTFTVLTGTASFGPATNLPAGFSDSDDSRMEVATTVTAGSSSTVYVRYNEPA